MKHFCPSSTLDLPTARAVNSLNTTINNISVLKDQVSKFLALKSSNISFRKRDEESEMWQIE